MAAPPRWNFREGDTKTAFVAHLDRCQAMMAAVPLLTFTVRGVELAYKAIHPPKSAAPSSVDLLILTGWNENLEKYAEVAHAATREWGDCAVSVYLMDHRGMGLSGRDPAIVDTPAVTFPEYGFEQYCEDVEQFVEQVVHRPDGSSSRPLCACAHSMGGLVASLVAARKPDLFSQMVLSAPLYGLKAEEAMSGFGSTVVAAMCGLGLGKTVMSGEKTMDCDRLADWKPLHDIHVTHDGDRDRNWDKVRRGLVEVRTTAGCAPGKVCTYVCTSAHWLAETMAAYRSLQSSMAANIICPVTIFQGDNDVLIPNDSHFAAAAQMRDCVVVNCGHGSYHELMMETDSIRNTFMAALKQMVACEALRVRDNLAASDPKAVKARRPNPPLDYGGAEGAADYNAVAAKEMRRGKPSPFVMRMQLSVCVICLIGQIWFWSSKFPNLTRALGF